MSVQTIDQHVGQESIDPLSFGVLNNYIGAIVDEMTITVLRTAYSPSVRDIMDFSPAICGQRRTGRCVHHERPVRGRDAPARRLYLQASVRG
jgi:hypothetical protein